MSGLNIYTLSVNDLDFLDTHTYRYKLVSCFVECIIICVSSILNCLVLIKRRLRFFSDRNPELMYAKTVFDQ